MMKRAESLVAVILVGIALIQLGCSKDNAFEQTALDHFVSTHWGPSLFSGECTGLEFEPSAPLLVFSEAPSFAITLADVAPLAVPDWRDKAIEGGGLQTLADQGTAEGFSTPVDLSAYAFAKTSENAEPKDRWEPSDGYFLRFSNRIRFNQRVYLQLWVKASRSSSGTRISYEFDDDGGLLRSTVSRDCDDWG